MNDNGKGSGSGSGRGGASGGFGGVYLRKLQYEVPYAIASSPANRYVSQDVMINATTALQDNVSTQKQAAGSAESVIWSRYGVALNNFLVFLTGFPEYLK